MKIKFLAVAGIVILFGMFFRRSSAMVEKGPGWYAEHPTYLSVVPHENQDLAMVREAVLANCTMAEYAAPGLMVELQKEPGVQKAISGCSPPIKERKAEKVRAAVLEFWRRRI